MNKWSKPLREMLTRFAQFLTIREPHGLGLSRCGAAYTRGCVSQQGVRQSPHAPRCLSRLGGASTWSAGGHKTRHHERDQRRQRGRRHGTQRQRDFFGVRRYRRQHDQEFNTWYTTEHLPELLAVPGILAAARYEAVQGGPKYLAFYQLEDIDVLHTPAFTNRPRTPWGARVAPSVIGTNLTRIVGEQIPGQNRDGGAGMAPVVQIGRMSVPPAVGAEWNAWYSNAYIPGYRKVPGVMYAPPLSGPRGHQRVYHGL